MNTTNQVSDMIVDTVIRLPNGKFYSLRKADGVVSKANSPLYFKASHLAEAMKKAPAGSRAIPYRYA